MAKKPTGLNKKISSIFSGIPSLKNEESPLSALEPTAELPGAQESFKTGQKSPSKFQSKPVIQKRSEVKNNTGAFFQFQARPRLIFDMDTSHIRAVLVKPSVRGWFIQDAHEVEFVTDVKGVRKRDEDQMVAALKEITHSLDPHRRASVGLVLGSTNSFFVVANAPEAPEAQWRDEAKWQLAEVAPFSLEDAEVEWMKLPRVVSTQSSNRIFVAAVQRFELESIAECFRKADLPLESIVPVPLTIEALMERYVHELPASYLIADFGAERTQLFIVVNGRFQFMREVTFGTDLVIRSLMGSIQIDNERVQIGFAEADALVHDYELFEALGKFDPDQPKRSQLSARVRPLMEKLVADFKRSVSYYQSEIGGADINDIFMTGGGAVLKGLDAYLAQEFKMAVKTLDLVKDFTWRISARAIQQTPSIQQAFAGPMGLAGIRVPKINFADWRDRWRVKATVAKRWMKITMLFILMLGGLSWTSLAFRQADVTHQMQVVQQKLDISGPRTAQLSALEGLGEQLEHRYAVLERAFGLEPLWGGVLRELTHVLPREIILRQIEVTEDKEGVKEMMLTGVIRATSRSSDVAVSDLLSALNESPFFTAAELLKRSQQQEEETIRATFRVKAQLV